MEDLQESGSDVAYFVMRSVDPIAVLKQGDCMA
jgi:hypothetical protein